MKKFTYNELGSDSSFVYDTSDFGNPKCMIVSDTLETINVVKGDDNNIKDMITSIDNIGSELTEIEEGSFKSCPNLSSINLPTTLQLIGSDAFKDCYKLSSFKDDNFNIPLEMGDNVFENCDFRNFKICNNKFNLNVDEVEFGENVVIGKKTFYNNKNLTMVSVDNIIFGQEMFENCTSLLSIVVNNNAQPLFSGASPFKNCTQLSTLTLPNVSSYFDIHEDFLKGSNISTFILSDMTREEVECAIGKKPKKQVIIKSDKPVECGDIYFYDTHNLDHVFIECIKNHIPLIIIQCYMDCGICKSFRKKILENPSFVNWLKNDFGKCSIMYCNDGGYGSRKPPAMPPNNNIEFDYDTKDNERKTYNTLNNNWIDFSVNSNLMNLSNGVNYITTKINVVDNKIFLYRLQSEYFSILKKSLDFDNNTYYKDVTNHNENPLLVYECTGWKSITYPLIGFFYRGYDDVTTTMCVKKFSEEQKSKFLNGEYFEFNIYNLKSYGESGYGFVETTIKFEPSLIDKKYNHINKKYNQKRYLFNINNRLICYMINGTSKFKLAFDCDNIYYIPPTHAITYENKDYSGLYYLKDMIKKSVDDAKKSIQGFYDKFFEPILLAPTPSYTEIETSNVYGNCWGVEHDCDVIDKDGSVHHYTYNPPQDTNTLENSK